LQISKEAKDLVSRLLKLNPSERLGAGPPGQPNDMQQLLKHPYFSELQLSQIFNTVLIIDLPS
jgi:3-phosphoinositide dependent protein kinase-1